MQERPKLGPSAEKKDVGGYVPLSTSAYATFHKLKEEHRDIVQLKQHHSVFLGFIYHAESTSAAAQLSNSWTLILPALALLRVRLEQIIVCSYLLHEREEVGIRRFIDYAPVGIHLGSEAAMSDERLLPRLVLHADMERSRTSAMKAQEKLSPGFSLEKDKFERKWTKLDLRAMARRRDKLASPEDKRLTHYLESAYVTIYKQTSSIIHTDGLSHSPIYLDYSVSREGKLVISVKPGYAALVASLVALYDIIQCYEVLSWLGVPSGSLYGELIEQWILVADSLPDNPS